jgi:hypothetical protein
MSKGFTVLPAKIPATPPTPPSESLRGRRLETNTKATHTNQLSIYPGTELADIEAAKGLLKDYVNQMTETPVDPSRIYRSLSPTVVELQCQETGPNACDTILEGSRPLNTQSQDALARGMYTVSKYLWDIGAAQQFHERTPDKPKADLICTYKPELSTVDTFPLWAETDATPESPIGIITTQPHVSDRDALAAFVQSTLINRHVSPFPLRAAHPGTALTLYEKQDFPNLMANNVATRLSVLGNTRIATNPSTSETLGQLDKYLLRVATTRDANRTAPYLHALKKEALALADLEIEEQRQRFINSEVVTTLVTTATEASASAIINHFTQLNPHGDRWKVFKLATRAACVTSVSTGIFLLQHAFSDREDSPFKTNRPASGYFCLAIATQTGLFGRTAQSLLGTYGLTSSLHNIVQAPMITLANYGLRVGLHTLVGAWARFRFPINFQDHQTQRFNQHRIHNNIQGEVTEASSEEAPELDEQQQRRDIPIIEARVINTPFIERAARSCWRNVSTIDNRLSHVIDTPHRLFFIATKALLRMATGGCLRRRPNRVAAEIIPTPEELRSTEALPRTSTETFSEI